VKSAEKPCRALIKTENIAPNAVYICGVNKGENGRANGIRALKQIQAFPQNPVTKAYPKFSERTIPQDCHTEITLRKTKVQTDKIL
jgi:hypothetical protein